MSATTKQSAKVTLQGDRELIIERDFDAPAHLVWRALTEPDLVRQWWHANRGEVTGCEIDLRVGGTWRYDARTTDGHEFAFYGEFIEIVPNEKIVQTEVFEPYPDAGSLNTMTLTEVDGVTRMRTLVQHDSAEARDAHIGSGMEAGMQDAFDLLEELAISLR